jgi:adenylylsulfate kinase
MEKDKGIVILLTGLSASGKSTIASALKERLDIINKSSYILDGDVLRKGLNSDLGLSPEDRNENIRRTFEVAALFADAGLISICAVISPYAKVRNYYKNNSKVPFYEVYLSCPVNECRKRDPKGLYAKHATGQIKGLTGVDDDAPYEIPQVPDIILETYMKSVDECVDELIEKIWG